MDLLPVPTLNPVLSTHWNSLKTHCKRGHQFTKENTGTRPNGNRFCRACKVIVTNRYIINKAEKLKGEMK